MKTTEINNSKRFRSLIIFLYILLIGLIALSFTSCQFELSDPDRECKEWNKSIDDEINYIKSTITGKPARITLKELKKLELSKCEI